MINILIISIIFYAIFRMFCVEYSYKLAENFTSAIHVFLSLVINCAFLYYNQIGIYLIGVLITTSYYIFDLFFLVTYKNFSLMTLAYIYHHIATIIYIHYNPYLYLCHYTLILAEISNIPALFIYYYLKADPNNSNLVIWKKIQKFVYIIIRIPLLVIIAYFIWINTYDVHAMLICGPVYLMGIIWSIKLISK